MLTVLTLVIQPAITHHHFNSIDLRVLLTRKRYYFSYEYMYFRIRACVENNLKNEIIFFHHFASFTDVAFAALISDK